MTTTKELKPPDGVPLKAWEKLAKREDNHWAIKERDATGEVIGTAFRFPNGEKGFQKGGKRGLIYPEPLNPYAGSSKHDPIFVCEGASDTGSLIGLGLDAVGVPATGLCGNMLVELLKHRHVVVVRDADEAGRNGSDKIVRELLPNSDSVRVIDPPHSAKDTREAVLKGATAQDFLDLARQAPELRNAPLVPEPGRDEFTWVSARELPPYTAPPGSGTATSHEVQSRCSLASGRAGRLSSSPICSETCISVQGSARKPSRVQCSW